MFKTVQIYASSSVGTATPYISNGYDLIGKVSFKFDIPEILKSITPTNIVFSLYAGGTSGTSGNSTWYSYYDLDPYTYLAKVTLGIKCGTDPLVTSSDMPYVGALILGNFIKTRDTGYTMYGYPMYGGMKYINITPYSIANAYLRLTSSDMFDFVGPVKGTPGKVFVYDENSVNKPYVTLSFDTGTPYTEALFPLGFINESAANTFSWKTSWSGYPIEEIEQQSAIIEWKNGVSGEIHTVSISGTATSYTFPAGTFPESNDIRWRVSATTPEGDATSPWRTIMTTDSVPTVTGLNPSGAYIDNTNTSRFTWQYSISTGTNQQKYDLQIKYPSGDWQTVKSEESADNFADIPAGTLSSGEMQWRVRGYNSDMVASAWSEPLSCVVVAVPAMPEVAVSNAVPCATVRWTANDQQAFQIRVGNYDSGLIFGAEKSYKLPVYLSDGLTSFSVRVMNSFGYWSDWGSASATITNVPSGTVTLTASAGNDVNLSWEAVETATKYRIFRDGIKIKDVSGINYTDKLSVGTHTYQVYALLEGDEYYTASDVVSAKVEIDHPIISTLDGDWISAEFSLSSLPSASSLLERDVYLMQYDGHEFPEVEVGEFRNNSYQLNVAFATAEDVKAFEELPGKIVVLKNHYNEIIVGVIGTLQKSKNIFTVNYTGTITEVDRSEYENS